VLRKEHLASFQDWKKRGSNFEAQVHHFFPEAIHNSRDLKTELKLEYPTLNSTQGKN